MHRQNLSHSYFLCLDVSLLSLLIPSLTVPAFIKQKYEDSNQLLNKKSTIYITILDKQDDEYTTSG
jgi:hypothetical protein